MRRTASRWRANRSDRRQVATRYGRDFIARASGPDGIPRDDARRWRDGERPERRPTTGRSGAPALVAITDVDHVPLEPRWTATACSRYAMNSARFVGTGIYRPAAVRRAENPQPHEISARSERLSRSLSSGPVGWAEPERLRSRSSGYDALRMFPRIGRSLMITQTFPITE